MHHHIHTSSAPFHTLKINPEQPLECLDEEDIADEFSGEGLGHEEVNPEDDSPSNQKSLPLYIKTAFDDNKANWLQHNDHDPLPKLYTKLSTF